MCAHKPILAALLAWPLFTQSALAQQRPSLQGLQQEIESLRAELDTLRGNLPATVLTEVYNTRSNEYTLNEDATQYELYTPMCEGNDVVIGAGYRIGTETFSSCISLLGSYGQGRQQWALYFQIHTECGGMKKASIWAICLRKASIR